MGIQLRWKVEFALSEWACRVRRQNISEKIWSLEQVLLRQFASFITTWLTVEQIKKTTKPLLKHTYGKLSLSIIS